MLSYDGYLAYLLIIDLILRYVWVFLTNTKEPPLDMIDKILFQFGHEHGGSICTNQGGKLA